MQDTTPAAPTINEPVDLPPPSQPHIQPAQPDSSLIVATTIRENFTTITELLKSYLASKKAGVIADAKADLHDTYATMAYSIVMVIICLAAVLYLSAQKVLDGVSAGTLVGTVVGYALSHLRPATSE